MTNFDFLDKIKNYLLSVIKQPMLFCSLILGFCACVYFKRFSFHIFIAGSICAYLYNAVAISLYDVLFKENLSNRIFKKFDIKDIKHIIKECDIEIYKNDFYNFYLTEDDKKELLMVLDNISNRLNIKE